MKRPDYNCNERILVAIGELENFAEVKTHYDTRVQRMLAEVYVPSYITNLLEDSFRNSHDYPHINELIEECKVVANAFRHESVKQSTMHAKVLRLISNMRNVCSYLLWLPVDGKPLEDDRSLAIKSELCRNIYEALNIAQRLGPKFSR